MVCLSTFLPTYIFTYPKSKQEATCATITTTICYKFWLTVDDFVVSPFPFFRLPYQSKYTNKFMYHSSACTVAASLHISQLQDQTWTKMPQKNLYKLSCSYLRRCDKSMSGRVSIITPCEISVVWCDYCVSFSHLDIFSENTKQRFSQYIYTLNRSYTVRTSIALSIIWEGSSSSTNHVYQALLNDAFFRP